MIRPRRFDVANSFQTEFLVKDFANFAKENGEETQMVAIDQNNTVRFKLIYGIGQRLQQQFAAPIRAVVQGKIQRGVPKEAIRIVEEQCETAAMRLVRRYEIDDMS